MFEKYACMMTQHRTRFESVLVCPLVLHFHAVLWRVGGIQMTYWTLMATQQRRRQIACLAKAPGLPRCAVAVQSSGRGVDMKLACSSSVWVHRLCGERSLDQPMACASHPKQRCLQLPPPELSAESGAVPHHGRQCHKLAARTRL